ncbi:MAG: BlaI/MecI/CopY family transcriptional regulator [Candidatus Galacturonibacter soehngenii]|uniref:BlaI/MecI/CopY family transcriptional regulator n=2 Tax=Candidatus Galacturonatibacter soehngenii TaxID=2307010 RepID=A0A7V7QHM5_9FIRM|nr:BlaI/MecI/CopY family transcriptional regulator [Candidatus Galacturonibacter soehngenii]MBA4686811.1 BlaI/MecI/CopY family transcriptional regulator [Candidatus Galacturonibacter soehngenii]
MMKSLGEAEFEIMQVIWDAKRSVTSSYVLEKLKERRKWQLSTVMTSLSRLSDKGFVMCDRSDGANKYFAMISENDYKAHESKNFLERIYDNSIQNLITTLYSNKVIKEADVKELRRFLDELEEKQ